MTLFNTIGVTSVQKQVATQLLTLSETDLYQHWLTKIAVDYWAGHYLRRASNRSRRLMFSKWRNELKQQAGAETAI
jgi:hypothetical protein